MPLHVPVAPASALHSVRTALGSSAGAPEHALPVHVLHLGTARGGLPHAERTGWQFLVRDGERVVAAETVRSADGWAFSHVSEGPFVSSTVRALRQAEALAGQYEPRVLSVPGLYMVALWLHSDAAGDDTAPGEADLLVPLAPAPPGIAAHRPHRVADLIPVLSLR
ncbi:hypothetical protein C0036_17940, partial [Streptomyces sp. DJ]